MLTYFSLIVSSALNSALFCAVVLLRMTSESPVLDKLDALLVDKLLQLDAVISLKHYWVTVDNDIEQQHPYNSIEPSSQQSIADEQ
jgi:hypothetical protein